MTPTAEDRRRCRLAVGRIEAELKRQRRPERDRRELEALVLECLLRRRRRAERDWSWRPSTPEQLEAVRRVRKGLIELRSWLQQMPETLYREMFAGQDVRDIEDDLEDAEVMYDSKPKATGNERRAAVEDAIRLLRAAGAEPKMYRPGALPRLAAVLHVGDERRFAEYWSAVRDLLGKGVGAY